MRVETLHALARALGVPTSALFATEAPRSVVAPGQRQPASPG